MTRNLDDLLTTLAQTPMESPAATFETGVWARVESLQGERTATRLRVGAVAMALVTGLTAGAFGAVAVPRPAGDMAIFSAHAGLSPLAQLETGR